MRRVVGYVPDLMDRSRILTAVSGLELATDLDDLLERAVGADVVLIDLGRAGAVHALPALVATGARVVGFASHVDADVVHAAAAAGCEVHARSRFFRTLPTLLER